MPTKSNLSTTVCWKINRDMMLHPFFSLRLNSLPLPHSCTPLPLSFPWCYCQEIHCITFIQYFINTVSWHDEVVSWRRQCDEIKTFNRASGRQWRKWFIYARILVTHASGQLQRKLFILQLMPERSPAGPSTPFTGIKKGFA